MYDKEIPINQDANSGSLPEASAAPKPVEAAMNLTKSIKLCDSFPELPLRERFAAAREFGFENVELGDWTDLEFSEMSDLLAKERLTLSAISGLRDGLPAEREEDILEFVSQSLAVARSFHCPRLVLAPRVDNAGLPRITETTRILMDAAKSASRSGITLLLKPPADSVRNGALENQVLPFGEIARMVRSPSLRLLCDAATLADDRDSGLHRWIRYSDLLGYVHVDVPPDAERNDLTESLARLTVTLTKTLGYAGIVGVSVPNPDMAELIASIW